MNRNVSGHIVRGGRTVVQCCAGVQRLLQALKFDDESAASSAAAAAQASSVCEEQVMRRGARVDDCAARDRR